MGGWPVGQHSARAHPHRTNSTVTQLHWQTHGWNAEASGTIISPLRCVPASRVWSRMLVLTADDEARRGALTSTILILSSRLVGSKNSVTTRHCSKYFHTRKNTSMRPNSLEREHFCGQLGVATDHKHRTPASGCTTHCSGPCAMPGSMIARKIPQSKNQARQPIKQTHDTRTVLRGEFIHQVRAQTAPRAHQSGRHQATPSRAPWTS
jgi:hypothetical protein